MKDNKILEDIDEDTNFILLDILRASLGALFLEHEEKQKIERCLRLLKGILNRLNWDEQIDLIQIEKILLSLRNANKMQLKQLFDDTQKKDINGEKHDKF